MREPDGPPQYALASAAATPTVVALPEGPPEAVQRALPEMLHAAADAFGDTVRALLQDLARISFGLDEMAWLALTPSLMGDEGLYRSAIEQMRWWESFLADLPLPRLLSEHTRAQVDQLRAERARVRLLARDQAWTEHCRRVEEMLVRGDLSPKERGQLMQIREDPDATTWWVDPEAAAQVALAALPPAPEVIPIGSHDLDFSANPSGFNAEQAMRRHPTLQPRARALDQALTAILRRDFKLSKGDAKNHAARLTGIFWLALRRALDEGDRQLAVAVQLMVPAEEAPIGEQFAADLLLSWQRYLEDLPAPKGRWERVKGLLGG